MAYVITNTRGQTIATILTGEDNTTATDLTLIGQNYIEFGLAQNENFVHILENFAAPTPPLHPIQGQLWFDTANGQLKVRTDVNTWTGLADQNYVQAQKISPEFTGVPRAPTAPGGAATSQIATTAFVQGEIATINLTPYARLALRHHHDAHWPYFYETWLGTRRSRNGLAQWRQPLGRTVRRTPEILRTSS